MSSSYELPSSVPEEDVLVLQNILTALESLGHGRDSTQTKKEGGGEDGTTSTTLCTRYKVDVVPAGGYLLCATLPDDRHFEVGLDDLLFLQSVSPARIESLAIGRASSSSVELFIRVLDARQHVMITSTTSYWSHSTRSKRLRRAPEAKK